MNTPQSTALLLLTSQALEVRRLALLAEAFSESDLPFKVDLLDWSTTDPGFRDQLHGHFLGRPEPGPRARAPACNSNCPVLTGRRHYVDGERLDHIAQELGVSPSKMSRMHSSALPSMAKLLRRVRPELAGM